MFVTLVTVLDKEVPHNACCYHTMMVLHPGNNYHILPHISIELLFELLAYPAIYRLLFELISWYNWEQLQLENRDRATQFPRVYVLTNKFAL